MQGCVVVNSKFASEHPDEVESFLAAYKSSVEFANSDPKSAAGLCEKYGILPKAVIAERAYPGANVVYITGDEMKKGLTEFLQVLFEASPSSVGGSMPGEDFFYEK